VDEQHGFRRVGHAGGMAGYLADLAYFPQQDLGVVMLTNLMDVTLLEAADLVVEALTGADRSFSRSGPAKGFYLSADAGFALQIDNDEAGTAICHLMGDRARLRGDAASGWIPAKRGVGYRIDPQSEPDVLTVRFGAQAPLRFLRFVDPPPAQDLDAFIGVYRSAVLGETHIVRRGDVGGIEVTLDSPLRSLAWGALLPRAPDVFSAILPNEPGASNLTLRFERDRAGRVKGFRYSTFRCRHILFERYHP
jgi:hypothetical protein